MNIIGKHVIIRAIEEKDLPAMFEAVNSAELDNSYEIHTGFPISLNSHKHWFESISKHDANNARLIIEYNGTAVGYISLINIDWVNRSAWNGIKLFSTDHMGKGIGTDAVMAIMRFAFESLNLNRLEGSLFEYNKASYGLYVEKCGWTVEGKKRQSVFKNGGYYDTICVAILKEDYTELVKKTNYWLT